MNKKLIVLQNGIKECGSAALLSIIRYYGGNISLSKLVELTNTTKEGTNFLNLKNASLKLGLSAVGYKINDINNLKEITCPFIVQLVNNNYSHFVTVYKIKNNKLLIMDPAKGRVIIDINSFIKLWTGYVMIFRPNRKLLIYEEERYLNKLILEVIFHNKRLIFNIFIISILFTLTSCLATYYFQVVMDNVIDSEYFNLISITLIFIIIALYKSFCSLFRNELLLYLTQKLDITLIINTINKILLLPYNYYKNKTTGEMISRVNDIAFIKNSISKITITVFLDIIICLVGGIILFNMNSKLFGILVIITLVYVLIILIFNRILKRLININQENNAKVNSMLVEFINGFETIKGLNIENYISNKFEDLYTNSLEVSLLYEKICNIEFFLKDLINSISNILIIFMGVKYVIYDNFTISSLITFNFLSSYYTEPIKNIIELNKEYYYMKNSLKRANDLFEVECLNNNKTNISVTGDINVVNLEFKYANNTILDKVNFNINNGEKVIILGNSGCGKSTLLKLLFKYYSVERNMIYINNYDICDYTVKDIRDNITYISQNETIFTDTIKNNIILDNEIDEETFLNIVKLTYIEDIIKDDILGYNKFLEENAFNLSGGQRQRIILARALLKNSKILLIDEGLNEIDIDLERKILKNIFNNYKDTTIIIISHRLNNLDLFDKVLKLEDGEITMITRSV